MPGPGRAARRGLRTDTGRSCCSPARTRAARCSRARGARSRARSSVGPSTREAHAPARTLRSSNGGVVGSMAKNERRGGRAAPRSGRVLRPDLGQSCAIGGSSCITSSVVPIATRVGLVAPALPKRRSQIWSTLPPGRSGRPKPRLRGEHPALARAGRSRCVYGPMPGGGRCSGRVAGVPAGTGALDGQRERVGERGVGLRERHDHATGAVVRVDRADAGVERRRSGEPSARARGPRRARSRSPSGGPRPSSAARAEPEGVGRGRPPRPRAGSRTRPGHQLRAVAALGVAIGERRRVDGAERLERARVGGQRRVEHPRERAGPDRDRAALARVAGGLAVAPAGRNPRQGQGRAGSPPLPRAADGGSSPALPASPPSDLRIRRETCIWERPTRLAIWVWGRPSSKRMRRISRSRAGRASSAGASVGAVLAALEALVLGPDRLERVEVLLAAECGGERDGGVGRAHLHRLEHLLGRGLQLLGDLGDRRRARQPAGQALDRARHRRVQLLERARARESPSPCRGSGA